MNTIKIISTFTVVLLIVVVYIIATKRNKEHFSKGLLTKDIDETLQALPNTVFYKELPSNILVKLFPKLPLEMPQVEIADFLANYMNNGLSKLSPTINTSNTPFLVKSVRKVSDNTLRIVLHREGKMYAIIIDVWYTQGNVTSIKLIGYLTEYDVTSLPGYDLSMRHTSFPNEFGETIIKHTNYEQKLLEKQKYGIKADRGIAG
jgi:hypothetical protein